MAVIKTVIGVVRGPQGIKGDKGDIGPQGPRGATGPQGATGIQGPIGPVGPAGKDGATGPQGIQGERGPQGIQGVKGATGATGPVGPVGPKGDIGPVGPQGPKGDKGDAGTSPDMTKYYTKSDVDIKLKKIVPVPVGGVLTMWNNTNPAELYSGTTWELITSGKYIQSGSTALQTGGNNSVSIGKANLPNVKLKIDSFQLGKGTQEITGEVGTPIPGSNGISGAFVQGTKDGGVAGGYFGVFRTSFQASRTWTGMSTSASPSTETLGSGTALSIQPAYITLKFWKRLS